MNITAMIISLSVLTYPNTWLYPAVRVSMYSHGRLHCYFAPCISRGKTWTVAGRNWRENLAWIEWKKTDPGITGPGSLLSDKSKSMLRIRAMYEANTPKMSNFWIFWSITLLRDDLIDSDRIAFMFNVGTFPDLSIHPIKNDSLLEHSIPAPLVYLWSHTLIWWAISWITGQNVHKLHILLLYHLCLINSMFP